MRLPTSDNLASDARLERASQATGRDLATMPESQQIEFIERLSRDQVDLALTLRNSHVATLAPHDLVTWARIAERTEVQRDYWKDLAVSVEKARNVVALNLRAEQRSRNTWRAFCLLFAIGWAVAVSTVFWP